MAARRTGLKLLTSLVVATILALAFLQPAAMSAPMVRVILQTDSMALARAAVRRHAGMVESTLPAIDALVVRVPLQQMAGLQEAPGVVRVTPDREVRAAGEGNQVDVEFPEVVGADAVWPSGNIGAGVTVAILDTGIEPRFPSLRRSSGSPSDRLLAYYDAIDGKLYEGHQLTRSPRDPNGHGTHVAGIIGNQAYEPQDDAYRGIAPGVNFVAVRVLNEEGAGTYADVLTGINWVIENKETYDIRVLNISMYAVPVAPYWIDPYNRAVMRAWESGIVVVASAGNTGPEPMSVGVPGNTPYVITVGAFTDNRTPADFSDDYIPEFSATGPTLDAFTKPDVIAPGAHVASLMRPNSYLRDLYPERRLNGHYFEMSGTSMSTAVVSGIAALVLSEHPELTPDEVKYRVMQTARPQFVEAAGTGIAAAYTIWEQGAGRVWAPDAVGAELVGAANQGLDIYADLYSDQHYQGWTTFNEATGEFELLGVSDWIDGYMTWDGSFDSWADGYEGVTNWAESFDSWAGSFDSGSDGWAWSGSFDSWASSFDSWADGFDSWAGGFDSWADACLVGGADGWIWSGSFSRWADGFDSWADSFDSWGDFTTRSASFDSWASSFDSWASSLVDDDQDWVDDAPASCQGRLDGFDSWAGGFYGWSLGVTGIADGLNLWSGAFSTWHGGYLSWATGFDSWAGSFDSWADGFDSWADACGIDTESESFDSWAGGFDSWADDFAGWIDGWIWSGSFDSWADYVAWTDSFDSWAGSFDSWAGSFDSWADGSLDGSEPIFCQNWVEGFDSWAGGFDSWAGSFDSWAGSFDSWADVDPHVTGVYAEWGGGYTTWAGGFDPWADGFDSWAGSAGDPTWAEAYANATNVPGPLAPVGINLWVDVEE